MTVIHPRFFPERSLQQFACLFTFEHWFYCFLYTPLKCDVLTCGVVVLLVCFFDGVA